ncbi:MAG: nitrate/nitrite two-component system sensor histidine kinase NarQ [Plesiomonas sp.]
MKQTSVARTIDRSLIGIVILSMISTLLGLMTLVSSLKDAEAINIAGSLRMQSYRIAYDLKTHSDALPEHLAHYQQSLTAPSLIRLDSPLTPHSLRQSYRSLLEIWQQIHQKINQNQNQHYLDQIVDYVSQIDHFVYELQRFSEIKLAIAGVTGGIGLIGILFLALFTMLFTRRQIIAPLDKLIAASKEVQNRQFAHQPLAVDLTNEMGGLSRTFTSMSAELSKLYRSLEEQVAMKTQSLTDANRSLSVLYECSQTLNVTQVDQPTLELLLDKVLQEEQLHGIQLEVTEHTVQSWILRRGEAQTTSTHQSLPLYMNDHILGILHWQCAPQQCPDVRLMENISRMIARGLYFSRLQKQQQQLLLMEERAIIARELHDSLAQALSFLRIQLTLLKRTLPHDQAKTYAIIADFEQALTDAYRQLRELLATFRLTIQEADLHQALEQILAPLQAQTSAHISLDCRLPSQVLTAQQQVHALQIVREAVLNAIKHANAHVIRISGHIADDGCNILSIADDGVGISSTEEPAGHYGLSIMSERATRLGGELSIQRTQPQGTEVQLTFRHH